MGKSKGGPPKVCKKCGHFFSGFHTECADCMRISGSASPGDLAKEAIAKGKSIKETEARTTDPKTKKQMSRPARNSLDSEEMDLAPMGKHGRKKADSSSDDSDDDWLKDEDPKKA